MIDRIAHRVAARAKAAWLEHDGVVQEEATFNDGDGDLRMQIVSKLNERGDSTSWYLITRSAHFGVTVESVTDLPSRLVTQWLLSALGRSLPKMDPVSNYQADTFKPHIRVTNGQRID